MDSCQTRLFLALQDESVSRDCLKQSLRRYLTVNMPYHNLVLWYETRVPTPKRPITTFVKVLLKPNHLEHQDESVSRDCLKQSLRRYSTVNMLTILWYSGIKPEYLHQ